MRSASAIFMPCTEAVTCLLQIVTLCGCEEKMGDQRGTKVDSSPPKKKSKNYDVEHIIMGEELSDLTINYAQELLKMHLNGFYSTLLQDKVVQLSHDEVKDKLQIIFCSAQRHWIVASTVGCKIDEVKVYDSLFRKGDQEDYSILVSSKGDCYNKVYSLPKTERFKGLSSI